MAVDKCGEAAAPNFTNIENVFTYTLPDFFLRMSFGAMIMPANNKFNRVLRDRVNIGCPSTTNIKTWAAMADAFARNRLGVDPSPYRSHVYIMPPSFGAGVSYGTIMCPLTGTNEVPGVWTAYSDGGLLWTMLHELGHNLGLLHSMGYDSNGIVQEYGDPSCPMGVHTVAHYNAPHSVWLGWTQPQWQLREADLNVGVWYSFPVTGLANKRISSIQLFPGTWTSSSAVSAWDYNDLLYVSFRHYKEGSVDVGLPESARNKVQIHRHARDLQGCGPPVLIATLDDGRNATWPRLRGAAAGPADAISPLLVVTVANINGAAGIATVKLCRASQFGPETGAQCRDGVDNNCDGLIDNC